MDSATQFPNGELLLFCLTSLSLHVPVKHLPPHHSCGSPEQMNKVFASTSRQETSAGGTLTFSPRQKSLLETHMSSGKQEREHTDKIQLLKLSLTPIEAP